MSGFIAPAPYIIMPYHLPSHARKLRAVWPLLAMVLVDGLLFGSTNTTNVNSALLMVGFIVLIITVYLLLRAGLALAHSCGLPFRHPQRLAASLSALVGILIALQSIGELGLRDVLVLLPLVVIGYAYSFYRYHQA